jgi:drug/metabolite transporter (DMT)-like permease
VAKIGLTHISPLSFAYLRVLGAALLLGGWQRSAGTLREVGREDRKSITIYAVLGVVINQALFIAGLSLTTAHEAAILISSIPLFTLGAALLIGRERLSLWKVAGIVTAGAGALLVLLPGSGHGGSTLGNGLILMNCLSYALYLIFSKGIMERLGPGAVVTRMFVVSAVLMLPLSLFNLLTEAWREIPPTAWLALGVVIVGPTVAAYTLNGWALARAESSLVAAYTYLQPVMASLLAAAILRERITGGVVIAGLLIIAGVSMASRRTAAASAATLPS